MRNIHRRFVLCSNGQIYGEDFAKFLGLLRMYELYLIYNWQFEWFLKNLTCNSRGVRLDACKVQQKVQYPNYDDVRSECTCTEP